jgi:hypothetical protein
LPRVERTGCQGDFLTVIKGDRFDGGMTFREENETEVPVKPFHKNIGHKNIHSLFLALGVTSGISLTFEYSFSSPNLQGSFSRGDS